MTKNAASSFRTEGARGFLSRSQKVAAWIDATIGKQKKSYLAGSAALLVNLQCGVL